MPRSAPVHLTRLKQITLALVALGGWLACADWPARPSVSSAQALTPLNYDIVYVRAPRYGDNNNTIWPEVTTPLLPDPGADLMLLHPNGSEEVLFAAGANGAVVDPYVAYDAKSVLFAYYPSSDLEQTLTRP